MMKYSHRNYLSLALFFVYIIITCMQISMDGLLPAWLYLSIAMVTVDITLFETVKSCINQIISCYRNLIQSNTDFKEFLQSHIDIYENIPQLRIEKQNMQLEIDKLPKEADEIKIIKRINGLKRFINISEFFQVFICACIILITPLMMIPYDMVTNKLIAVISLISFAFTFLALFVNSFSNRENTSNDSDDYLKYSKYYLEVIKKITANTLSNDNTEE